MPGSVYTLDLAAQTGWAKGSAGSLPLSGSVMLRRAGQPPGVAFGNLIAFLAEEWAEERPVLVVKEALLPLQAFLKLGNADATVRFQDGLHGIVAGLCHRFGIECMNVADSTARKHFVGKGRMGTRAETKAAVVQRCHSLGYMPRESHDDNRADALATWDWACTTHMRAPPRELHMFGEGART